MVRGLAQTSTATGKDGYMSMRVHSDHIERACCCRCTPYAVSDPARRQFEIVVKWQGSWLAGLAFLMPITALRLQARVPELDRPQPAYRHSLTLHTYSRLSFAPGDCPLVQSSQVSSGARTSSSAQTSTWTALDGRPCHLLGILLLWSDSDGGSSHLQVCCRSGCSSQANL